MKKILFTVSVIVVLLLLFLPSIRHSLKSSLDIETPPILNLDNGQEQHLKEKTELSGLLTSTWKVFTFSYPISLKVSDGGFSEQFFYLDYEGLPEKKFRIYGISENWIGKEFTIKDEQFRREQFEAYTLEYEDIKTPSTYISQFTLRVPDETLIRIYRVAYEKAGFVYYLHVYAPKEFWDNNQELMADVINSIRY